VVNEQTFVDFYEVLQLSQNADAETVERVYRLLAKRYHPDNRESGDEEKFKIVHTAFEILGDPERRAQYDVKYDRQKNTHWRIFTEGTNQGGHQDDQRIMNGLLTLLYSARRRDPLRGGFGALELERMLAVPREHLEFPLWILKQRAWIEIQDNGQIGITIHGVEQVIGEGLGPPEDRLLAETSASREGDGGTSSHRTWDDETSSYREGHE
jgi:curved DNA-binding protein